jgi:hypothetical protein
MVARTRPFALVLSALGAAVAGTGCDDCNRRPEKPERSELELEAWRGKRCTTHADCQDRDPCSRHECVDDRCVVTLAPRGTSCDNGTVCDGVSTCDENGRCVAGRPPLIDDGNACTIDSCDPTRGAVHEALPVDDFDACTADSCDAATGAIAHTTLPVDDGNDCTKDSCDPRVGVKHEQPNPVYTCQATCASGVHVASRSPSAECGSSKALRSFCAPNCGPSFHTCETNCPSGYRRTAASPGGACGTTPSVMIFCVKD